MEKISEEYVDSLIDPDEVPELTDEELKQAVPFASLPPEHQADLLAFKNGPVQIRHTVALDPNVVAGFRRRGGDWQREMDAILLKRLNEHVA